MGVDVVNKTKTYVSMVRVNPFNVDTHQIHAPATLMTFGDDYSIAALPAFR